MEKAFAKFIENYAKLGGGNEWESLRAMTGMPVKNYKSSSMTESEIYALVSESDKAGYVMTAGCYSSMDGLVSGHAYTMLGVNDATGRIQVRNPWSAEQYTGPGSDQNNDGRFEVPMSTFKVAFSEFTILKYKDWHKWNLGKQTLQSTDWTSYEIYSFREQEVIVTLDLASHRQMAGSCV